MLISFLPEYQKVAAYLPPPILPHKSSDAPKVTLVLDMDETLIHSSCDPRAPHDHVLAFSEQGLETKVRSDHSFPRFMSVSGPGHNGSFKRPPNISKSSSSRLQR